MALVHDAAGRIASIAIAHMIAAKSRSYVADSTTFME